MAVLAIIVILSTKPRIVPVVNNYVYSKLNKLPNSNVDFDKLKATLYIDSNMDLHYEIKDISFKSPNIIFKLDKMFLNLNFSSLLFGRFEINNIILTDTDFELKLSSDGDKKESNPDSLNHRQLVEQAQKIIARLFDNSIVIKKFTMKDFDIALSIDGKKNNIRIVDSRFNLNLVNNNLTINQDVVFNINKSRVNSRMKLSCKNDGRKKACKSELQNINPVNFTGFFDSKDVIYGYLTNIRGVFDVKINFDLDKRFNFEKGYVELVSAIGFFDLKQFFDGKISFTNLDVKAGFKDNFKELNISSVTARLNDVDFSMNLSMKEEKDLTNLDMYFNAKKVPIKSLRRLWPNFLGQEEGIRPWVLDHVTDGESPNAWAKMNFKYFKNDTRNESGLQELYSEVQIKNGLLNYDDYFPKVRNINGLAVFTEKDMSINVLSANVLSSKVSNGNIAINFLEDKRSVFIKAKTKGPISDLFVHIDKEDKDMIENNVNTAIEDFYTSSNIEIAVPLSEDISFNSVNIIVDSVISNKTNSLIKNSSNIKASFIKPKNGESFFGDLDFTKSNIEFLPLNIYKPSGESFRFRYGAVVDGDIVSITDFTPLDDYISFNISGFVDIKNDIQKIDINDIKHNNSRYSISYDSSTIDGKIYSEASITGENINYENIIGKLRSLEVKKEEPGKKVNNELTIKLAVKSFDFLHGKKLYDPDLFATFKNSKLEAFKFKANIKPKGNVDITLNKRQKMFNIKSSSFGDLFNVIGLTGKIRDGEGEVNINQKNIKGKNVLVGSLDIAKPFSLLSEDYVKEEVLSDVHNDENFKELKRGLNKNSPLRFERMRGDFSISDDVIKLEEIVTNSKNIKFQILVSGTINMKTEQMNIEGLLVPLGMINGLFGVNKLPFISDILFGQKDGGLFASKFTITKANADDKMKIDIDKFSILLPGFIRNIFSR